MYQQINLYQPIFRKQRQIFSAVTLLQAAGVIAAALLAIYFYGLWNVAALEKEVALLEGREQAFTARLARVDPSLSASRRSDVAEEIEKLDSTVLDQQRLIDVLRDQPLGSTAGFSAYLAALGRQHTPELWLTAVAVNGVSGALELAGRSVSAELVPEYLQRLGRETALAGQRFDQLTIERDPANGEVVFHATSQAAAPEAVAAAERR